MQRAGTERDAHSLGVSLEIAEALGIFTPGALVDRSYGSSLSFALFLLAARGGNGGGEEL